MAQPFKFRYVNEIVGSFVLLTAGLLLVTLFLAAKSQGWFDPEYKILIGLPASDRMELPEGATVSLMNKQVGSVREVRLNEDGSLDAVLRLKGINVLRLVRKDSKVIIKRKLGVAGDFFVSISRGLGDTLSDAELEGQAKAFDATLEFDLSEQVLKIAQDLNERVINLFETLDPMIKNIAGLTGSLNDPEGDFKMAIANARYVFGRMKEGEGAIGVLLKDEAVKTNMVAAVQGLRDAVDPVNRLLADLEAGKGAAGVLLKDEDVAGDIKGAAHGAGALIASLNTLTAALNQGQGTAGALLKDEELSADIKGTVSGLNTVLQDLPQMLGEVETALREFEQSMNALQDHWLLRKYVEDEKGGRLQPGLPGGRK